jgi:hypothetical protein
MASNLPPGVTELMIPGNRPEDALWEALYDTLYSLSLHGVKFEDLRETWDEASKEATADDRRMFPEDGQP